MAGNFFTCHLAIDCWLSTIVGLLGCFDIILILAIVSTVWLLIGLKTCGKLLFFFFEGTCVNFVFIKK